MGDKSPKSTRKHAAQKQNAKSVAQERKRVAEVAKQPKK